MWIYKKKCSPINLFQNNTELFQSSLSEPTAGSRCHEKYYPKTILKIRKYSGQSPLLAELQANRHIIQHSIYSKINCCKARWVFPESFPEAFPEAFSEAFHEVHSEAFLQSIPRFPSFHSLPRVLMIAFYYVFTNVLFTTNFKKYMAYENSIISMGKLFNQIHLLGMH